MCPTGIQAKACRPKKSPSGEKHKRTVFLTERTTYAKVQRLEPFEPHGWMPAMSVEGIQESWAVCTGRG